MTAIASMNHWDSTQKYLKKTVQSAAKRARQKARNGEFELKADNFDGSVPIEENA